MEELIMRKKLMKELGNTILPIIEITSSQCLFSRLIYARELVRKLSANHLLVISSTTEYLVDREVRTISSTDIPALLIAAGFFVLI
jgi:hypothetical protein